MRHKTWKCPLGRVGMRKTDRWKTEKIWRCKTAGLNKRAAGVDVHACIMRGLVINACLILKTCARSKKRLDFSHHRTAVWWRKGVLLAPAHESRLGGWGVGGGKEASPSGP